MMYRKILSLALSSCLIASTAFAAPKECSYTPLQQLIRTARSSNDIIKLINNQVNLNYQYKCGGNVYQLAILRGNPSIVKTLIEESKIPLDMMVSNTDYPIPGAPKDIPLVFFAAYYSPSVEIMKLFVDHGADILVTDMKGETILRYLNQNPVLMNTDLVDEIVNKLIMGAPKNNTPTQEAAPAKEVEKEAPASSSNAKSAPAKKEARPAPVDKKKAKSKSSNTEGEDFGVVENEPDAPFNPDDSSLSQSEF